MQRPVPGSAGLFGLEGRCFCMRDSAPPPRIPFRHVCPSARSILHPPSRTRSQRLPLRASCAPPGPRSRFFPCFITSSASRTPCFPALRIRGTVLSFPAPLPHRSTPPVFSVAPSLFLPHPPTPIAFSRAVSASSAHVGAFPPCAASAPPASRPHVVPLPALCLPRRVSRAVFPSPRSTPRVPLPRPIRFPASFPPVFFCYLQMQNKCLTSTLHLYKFALSTGHQSCGRIPDRVRPENPRRLP